MNAITHHMAFLVLITSKMEDKKYFLIYVDPVNETIVNRISKIGDRVFIDDCLYLVKTSDDVFNIYQKLTAPPFDEANIEIFVTELHPERGEVFGKCSSNVWRFLGLYTDEQQKDEETIKEEEKTL